MGPKTLFGLLRPLYYQRAKDPQPILACSNVGSLQVSVDTVEFWEDYGQAEAPDVLAALQGTWYMKD